MIVASEEDEESLEEVKYFMSLFVRVVVVVFLLRMRLYDLLACILHSYTL